MAYIEKVCEYSGTYPNFEFGENMWKWKKDSIQVKPRYYGNFFGKEHTLYVFAPEQFDIEIDDNFQYKFEYQYCLYVPSLPDKKEGEYWNHTKNLNHVYYNLWEIMGRQTLEVCMCKYPFSEMRKMFEEEFKKQSTDYKDKTIWDFINDHVGCTEWMIYNKEGDNHES